jgi:hypothetical protein
MLEITLSFVRDDEANGWNETFNHMFKNDDEALGPVLEKMETFLKQMGFVIDGKRLELVREDVNFDVTDYGDIITFPTSNNQD